MEEVYISFFQSTMTERNETDNESIDSNSFIDKKSVVEQNHESKRYKQRKKLKLKLTLENTSSSSEFSSKNSLISKRNISELDLAEKNSESPSDMRTHEELNKIFEERKAFTKNKGVQTCTTPISETDSDEVEMRRPKRSNFRRVVAQGFRESFRLVKRIRPRSDSEVGTQDGLLRPEQFTRFRNITAAIVSNPYNSLMLQPPAPLVVEDPPSTDEEGLNDLRSNNPALLNGSSGNFGSAGPRSAPSTPQGQLGAPQGQPEPLASPTIQRSPSHSGFTKVEKTNLKHLSTSTPAMTAQGQLAEPPSPKAVKDPKVHTTSKARQKKFLRHFPNVEEDEKVLNHYSCALIGDILLQGHLYITKNYFAFYSNVFGYVTKLLIPILTVEEITKEKTARIIPNAVGIATSEDKHIFGSLMSRDSTLNYMRTVWEKAKSEEAVPEPEITEVEQDSSESGESGRETPPLDAIPSGSEVLASAKFDRIRKETIRDQSEGSLLERKGSRGFIRTLKDAIFEFRKLPRQSLILVATTLLLILLFLSAAVLLYRINKIQNRYSISLQGASLSSTSEDIYSDLLQWQTHLHSKSADAVNNFLDNNLDQIAKVRQSLEALSTLLTGQNQQALHIKSPSKIEESPPNAESASTSTASNNS